VRVRAGDKVAAGQVLVVLDDRDAAARAAQADAGVTAAEQALAAARADQAAAAAEQKLAAAWHTRISALRTRDSATAQELDDAEARVAAANAAVEAARARLEGATAQVAAARAGSGAASVVRSFSSITAPFAGIVTERLADPGDLASPGVPLLRLDAVGTPRVEARVDESRIPFVRVGDEVEVIVDHGEAPAVTGVVSEIARAVDPSARAFTVKVSLPAGHTATTGTFARIRFRGAARRALVVPAAAVRRQGQVTSVFVVRDDVARLRLVQLGSLGPDGAEVVAGLDAGERVVIDPPAALTDGAPVGVRP
jgi:RND family efflux transporter MFP subunit